MSGFPSLAQVLARHMDTIQGECSCLEFEYDHYDKWAEHVSEAWCEARTIRTVDELDALPFGSIVRGANGHAFEKSDEAWAFQDRAWGEAGNASPDRSEDIPLDALLLWSPEWNQP